MTRKQKKLSQLDEGISNAKLVYSFFCYYKQNLADLIFLNTGLENLKPQFGTGPTPMPHPQKNGVGGGRKSSENQMFLSCIIFMVWFASNSP